MKIAISANTSWYVFNFRKNLIRRLLKAGHQVFVIAPLDDYSEKLLSLGVQYHPLAISQRGTNIFREFSTCVKLLRLLKRIQPDFVLTFTVKCNLYTGLCSRLLNFKQIANISGLGEVFDKKGLLNYAVCCLYKYALRKAKRVFFQNNEDMHTILDKGLLPSNLCKRIPGSGVDLATFFPSPSYAVNKPLRFFMFGRIVPNKGYDLFITAAENFSRKFESNAEFWIMGIVDNSRAESKKLLEKILSLHEKEIVKFLPQSDDVVKVLRQIDVVVLPSKYNEGVPRSLLEAMACGKPIITTDWKGCRDTVDHGINGYLIDVNDSNALENCLLKVYNTSDDSLIKMGEMSRRKAEDQFDEKQILDAYWTDIHL